MRECPHIQMVTMSLLTSHVFSPIHAHVNMHSSLPSGRSGSFYVNAETTGAALLTDIRSAPLDSHLEVGASTYFGDAEVRLPPSYEGELGLWNTNGGGQLHCRDSNVLDPAGEGRERDLRYVVGVNSLRGSLAWIPQHTQPGSGNVLIETTKGIARVVCPDDMT
jgi:hypothetical protein